MKPRLRVTGPQIDKLLAELGADRPGRRQPGPFESHLTDDEFTGYARGALTAEETERVDRHLARCESCLADMEHLVDELAAWRAAERRRRLWAELRRQLQAALIGLLPRFFPDPERLWGDAGEEAPVSGSVADRIEWRLEQDGRVLRIELESRDPELAGARLQLSAGAWTSERLVLEPGAFRPGTAGAVLEVPAEAMREWLPAPDLVISILSSDETASSG